MNDKKMSKNEKIGLIIAVIALILLFFMPTPQGMSPQAQKSLAIFVFSLIMWISKPIPIYLTSIIAILLLPLTGAVEDQEVAFGTLGFDIIWLMIAAFVLTSAMSETNLGKRIALKLITKYGKTPRNTLAVLIIINFILAFFVPSTTARASLLVPILLVLLEVYNATPGESKFGKFMMLQGVVNNALSTTMVLTATSAQVIAIGFINQQTHAKLGYMDWLLGSLPQAVFSAIIMFLIGLKLYNFESELPSGEKADKIRDIFKKQLETLGSMSIEEKKAAFIFFITLILWGTGDYQKQWFGFEITTEQTAVLAMLLCFLPRIGVLKWKEANIKWDLMIFSAGAYAVGNALNDSEGASYLINHLVKAMHLDQFNHALVAVILIFITVFSHLIFTSKTVRTTILIPSIITLTTQLGMNPVPIALACSYGIAYTITLPPHSKVNTLYFGTGYFSVLDELKYGLIGCTVGSIMISIIYFGWLNIVI
ncbi:DASS family sodium-coupled anion symporter [Macrococcus sp. S115]|uniref:SLC13 family permease n=1 Tax=Macrococcus sp. S115 TaxID=3047480 RepID=UPI0024BD3EA5|nr:DASS family sodium-coupled anion symporter [Macrococcus sp. S115]MDJ1112641.1 DASS family sodium-coupled anion symporter [Macrococcus sp. S115]